MSLHSPWRHRPGDDPQRGAPDTADDEFVQAAARRLGLVGLTMACAAALGITLNTFNNHFLGWGPPGGPWAKGRWVGTAVLVGMSLVVFALSRSRIDPRRMLNLGLVYQLLGAVGMALALYKTDRHLVGVAATFGWLGMWILIFPLFVPARPLKNIVTGVLAASCAPAVYFLFVAVEGRPLASPRVIISTFFPYYWCAGLAAVPSILLYRLSRSVTAARREVERLDGLLRTERLAVAGSLAAGVAHEVNNPLAAISSLVQTVQSKSQDARSREMLGSALRHMDRIAASLQALMRFARPPARVAQDCSLNEVVERTLRLLRHDRRFRELPIETRLDDALGTIHADPDQLQQVLTNLLINARDALQDSPQPRIVVSTHDSQDGEAVELVVDDNGPGIAPATRGQVFEPFFTTKPPGQGTGLGLAVCRELLREHAGTIALESEHGRGTRARIALPVGGGTS